MRDIFLRYTIAAVCLVAAVYFSNDYAFTRLDTSSSQKHDRLDKLWEISSFQLIDSKGQKFDSAVLKDKVWVGNFMFTQCTGPCPITSGRLKAIQDKIPQTAFFRLVSISLDPDFDTPEVLNTYGNKFHYDPNRWFFLTGEINAIYAAAKTSLRLPAGEKPDMHSNKMLVVDKKGWVRKALDSEKPTDFEILEQSVKTLLDEG